MRTPPSIDRVSADDLMSLVAEHGSTPMQVGAVLLLDTTPGLDPTRLVTELGRRVAGIPRLRQRLETVPVGCGRPIWVDDPGFDMSRHVRVRVLGDPLAEQEVLDIAATLLGTPLPRSRPLWTATLVVTPAGTEAALIVVFHHVLADGIGGLAVLAGLVDGAPGPTVPTAPFPRPRPSPRQIAADMLRLRLRALRRLPQDLLRLAAAAGQLRLVGGSRLPSTSLNVPTGPRRRFLEIRVDLPQILSAARARQATVNDVLLVAIAGALHTLLLSRGERVDEVVVSVPFSARLQASAGQLGNASGVIPLRIPAVGDPDERLRRVAALTRTAKRTARGASTALIGPLFRLLARLGLYRRFIDGQRLIHTFTSNVRGPAEPLTLVGCPITALLPLSAATGNVTVAFAALSYAGTLVITIVADPDACPDLQALREALVTELAALGLTAIGGVRPA
ncbi:wax ester/triacylglycerol synthase domain-containing protein [Cryobacterium soli]|uniref:wax ester/triacylglycerol synthase domain-containing protein n=1 Tax=Cryobacterium soli TaxID=2220095 RepID=UPI000E70E4EB|nr:wax ester/triacylglycerol synthase domain-containing protein [Cryobacterium soli]